MRVDVPDAWGSTEQGSESKRYNSEGERAWRGQAGRAQMANEPIKTAAAEKPRAAIGRVAAPVFAVGVDEAAAAGSVTPAGSAEGVATSAPAGQPDNDVRRTERLAGRHAVVEASLLVRSAGLDVSACR